MANSYDSRRPVHLLLIPLPTQGHLIPSLISPTTSPTTSPPPAPPSPSPSSSPQPTSASSTPSSPRSPPPNPSSSPSPSPPTPPSPSALSTFTSSPNELHLRSRPHTLPPRPRCPPLGPIPSPPPSALLSDFFLGWANRLAADLAIPSLAFYCPSTFAVSIIDYLWPRMPRREDGDDPASLTVLSELPSSSVFPFDHLLGIWR